MEATSSSDLYRALFTKSRTINLLINPATGAVRDANEAACRYYGYSHAELTALTIYDINVLSPAEIQAEMAAAHREQRNYFLFAHRLASGEIRQVEVYSSPIPVGDETLLHSVIFDVEAKRRAELGAAEERVQFLALLDTIPHGIYVSDMDTYEVLFVNRALKRAFGEELVGRRCYEALQGKSAVCPFCTNERLRASHEPYFWEYHNPLTNRDYEVMDRCITWSDGRTVRFELAVDITERKQTAEQLRDLNRAKDTLMSVIAHDVRSPLLSVVSLLRLVDEGVLTPGTPEFGDAMHSLRISTESTYELLETLLDWAHAQGGSLVFNPQSLALAECATEITETLATAAAAKDIDLQVDVSDTVVLQADHAMVRVVLRNLLTNAIKFSHRGGAVSLHATEGDGWVSVTVRDNGVGIPLSRQETLFQRTERAQRGTANERGAGIGLSLAASFVERHGGHICVESEPGSGSAFQVDLPVVQPQ